MFKTKFERHPHTHKWELVSKTYAAPASTNFMTSGQVQFTDRTIFGLTTLLWHCPSCSETRKDELLGSDSDTLDELLTRVDNLGPQTIDRGASHYVIGKAPVEPALPVR